jgi:hypothetical protein
MRNLCVDIIEQLNNAQVPTLLALKMPKSGSSIQISTIDLLRYLVRQALQTGRDLRTEKPMSLTCATIHQATTEIEWFQVLEAALADIGSHVYIIVDLDVLDKNFCPNDGFSWVHAFQRAFEALHQRGSSTKLKVLLVGCGAPKHQLSAAEHATYVISAEPRPQQRYVNKSWHSVENCFNNHYECRSHW